MSTRDSYAEVVGLLPAAGRATRVAPLPCSKEIYPVGFRALDDGSIRPKVACHYVLEKMRSAGITKAYIVIREGKWDILGYLGEGSLVGMHLAYLVVPSTWGVPFTLDRPYPFIRDATVAFGFPDLLFESGDAFVRLLSSREADGGDIVLGLFPGDEPRRMDMVEVDERGEVERVMVRPAATQLTLTWGIAVWTPVFTRFLHQYVGGHVGSQAIETEVHVGHVIQAAIESGLRARAIRVSDEPFVDIGTPQGLTRAVARFAAQ